MATWLTTQVPLPLIAACLVLLPVGRSVEVPVLLLAVWGAVLVVRRGSAVFSQPAVRIYTLLFALFWLPTQLALLGAIEADVSARASWSMLRFYFAGVFIIVALRTDARRDRLLRVAALVVAFWVVDALIQALGGTNLFGYRHPPGYLNGVFGEDRLKLGMTLAVFAPLLFDWVWRQWPTWTRFVVFPLTALVVLLGGSRSGWVMFALVGIGLFLWHGAAHRRLARVGAVLAIVLALGAAAGAYRYSDDFAERARLTLRLLRGDASSVDAALSGRLWIWRVSARMFADHPVTGVGVRGFRHGYAAYADPGDPFLDTVANEGASYAHLYLLEVLTETGCIGLLALGALYVVALRAWRRAPLERKEAALPFALALLAAFFPLNSNGALYSSYWSQIIWYLAALTLAALYGEAARDPVRAAERP